MFDKKNIPAAFFALLLMATAPHAQAPATYPSDDPFVPGEAMAIDVPLDTAAFIRGGYAVDSAGFVDLPVLGRINVTGKTRSEVEEYLGQKLANYLKDTHVRAIPAIRLTLVGHWVHQGQYYVSPKTTVWEAVYKAGGMAGERTMDEITVQRGERTQSISLLTEYSRGATLAAAGIRSGDIFIMPVPRDNAGGWYWFKEGLTATAQIATVISSVFLTYFLVVNRNK